MTISEQVMTLGIEIKSEYQPHTNPVWSTKRSEQRLQLNWKVTLTRNSYSMTIDYHQGLGYLPNWKEPKTVYEVEQVQQILKTGKTTLGKIQPPSLTEIMECLIMDANVLDYASFEEWASDFGYNPDSIKDYRVYRACVTEALQLRRLIGDGGIRMLQESEQ